MTRTPSKAHFVLVHGHGHGAWCWYKVRCNLETDGYKVTCLDLKGSGIDPHDPNKVTDMVDYNQPLIHFFSNLPSHEKVILVGHSAGGVSVTYASYKFTDKIQVAVYVSAPMLKHGFSSDWTPDFPDFGDVYDYEYALGPDQPPTSLMIKKEFQREILYHLSPKEDSTLAAMVVRPGSTACSKGAQFTGDEADRVPRVYVRSLYDRVWKLQVQDEMISMWPPCKVFTLPSEHSPFFSAPSELSDSLKEIASIGIKSSL